MPDTPEIDLYDAQYRRFATALYEEIRRAAFGEDIGQNGWLTAEEHDLFIRWLSLGKETRLLDVACGSGRTTLRIAERTDCSVLGIEIHADEWWLLPTLTLAQEAEQKALDERQLVDDARRSGGQGGGPRGSPRP